MIKKISRKENCARRMKLEIKITALSQIMIYGRGGCEENNDTKNGRESLGDRDKEIEINIHIIFWMSVDGISQEREYREGNLSKKVDLPHLPKGKKGTKVRNTTQRGEGNQKRQNF